MIAKDLFEEFSNPAPESTPKDQSSKTDELKTSKTDTLKEKRSPKSREYNVDMTSNQHLMTLESYPYAEIYAKGARTPKKPPDGASKAAIR